MSIIWKYALEKKGTHIHPHQQCKCVICAATHMYLRQTCLKDLSAADPLQGSGTQDYTVDSWDLEKQAHWCIRDLD